MDLLTFPIESKHKCYALLQSTLNLLLLPLTEYQTLTVHNCFVNVLIEIAFLSIYSQSNSNRKMYKSDKLIINFLKMAVKICDVSQFVYLAMHNYRTFRFKEALKVTILVKSKLTQSFIPYKNIEKREFYNKSVSGLSLSKRIRKVWAKFVKLYSGNTYYLSELLFEQKLCEEKGIAYLFISPYVFADMLSVLYNSRLGNRSQCL